MKAPILCTLACSAFLIQYGSLCADERIDAIFADQRQREALALERLEKVERQLEEARKNFKSARDVQGWATKDFAEFSNSRDIPAKTAGIPRDRYRELSGKIGDRLLKAETETAAAWVRAGSGLNWFLDAVGETAFQHEKYLREHAELADDVLEERYGVDGAQMHANRRAHLIEMRSEFKIPVEVLRNIRVQYAGQRKPVPMTAAFDSTDLTFDAAKIDWPQELRARSDMVAYMSKVEEQANLFVENRRKAESLSTDKDSIDPTAKFKDAAALMAAVDKLTTRFMRNYNAHMESVRSRRSRTSYDRSYGKNTMERVIAKRFILKLRKQMATLIATEHFPSDVSYRISAIDFDDSVSVTTLLAIMHERGLSFADATHNSASSHMSIFSRMRGYYRSLVATRMAVEEQEQNVESNMQRVDNAIASLEQQTEITDQRLRADRQLEFDQTLVRTIGQTLGDIFGKN